MRSISGGVHIQSVAKLIPSRQRRQPRTLPHAASAAIAGKAKLPVPLLNSVNGAQGSGRLIQSIAPRAAARAAEPITVGASGARIAAPAAIAIASINALRDPVTEKSNRFRAIRYAIQTPSPPKASTAVR